MERPKAIPARLSREEVESFLIYNLFRRKSTPHLHCAVPEDRVVPHFLSEGDWEVVGTTTEMSPALPGFRANQARSGVRLTGFYLFMAHDVRLRKAPSAPGSKLNAA